MPEFIFNSDKHVYTLDGVALPSVTSILKAEGLMGDMQFATEWHMDRGTHVHRTIELYLSGTLNEETLDPQLRPYLSAFKAFMAATGFEVYGYETQMFHPMYRYAGTPDLWGLLDGKLTVFDIKTGVSAAWHKAQCGAYVFLIEAGTMYLPPPRTVSQAGCLYLA